ncbi:bactofilin family protein [Nonlabens ponticola]|uniref:Polymer-forming cytoskeletal protein n=1 Tax=Nonlabens ponticola TaxID=2496866 RepID=A0A3S9MVP7_9FLAO|nr:polymer-forming cytoskeletal protein [Nonlabens ponticola]AZQ43207.1 polymer-forming cytoskeletal protein [Nonlabens ponticola]
MKNSKNQTDTGNSQNRIGHGTVIQGDVTSDSGFRIDGEIKGTLKSPSKVVIGKDGKIEGTLECQSADIEGTFKGNLVVSGLLTLKSTAVIEGDVVIDKLAVEPGATFNASCTMQSNVKSIRDRNAGKSA